MSASARSRALASSSPPERRTDPPPPVNHRRAFTITALVLTAVFGLGTTGCAKTTIDPSVTAEPAGTTTTTIPTGTPSELLPRMLTEVAKLSRAVGENDHKGEQITLVNDLWNAVRPQIAAVDGVVVSSFDGMIDLCQRAEKFNRPADADKCLRNLTALSDAFLAKNPG